MAGLAGIELDHYKLVEEVGRGGMATVCLAIDSLNQKNVAVKVLSPTISGDNRFVQRFKRESSLLAGLDHPNIVPVIDFGESKGMVYMVMPFVEGETLQERMENRKVRRRRERERWILQITDALSFAHNKGIIHRDVKPSNVLIDNSGNALLTDFGLAREVEGSNTLTGSMLLGTPAYMAPEQGRGDKVDARSDQYSLGVIIYHLITGRLPFEADSPMGTVLKHIQEPVPRPSRFVRNMSPSLERVILKCLAKDPEYRYPSVGAFYQAYRAAREGASLSELELDTVAVPVDSILREESPDYQLELEPVPKRRRSMRVAMFLIGIPVVILGAVVVYPAINSFMESVFSAGTFATAIPPEVATEASIMIPSPVPATRTPQPTPIAINSPGICLNGPGVEIYSPRVEGNNIIWSFFNGDDEVVDMEFAIDDFPENNASLLSIKMGESTIWEGSESDPALVELGEASLQQLATSKVTEFSLEFALAPANNGYQITLDFGVGCVIKAEW
jgi:serine/threonine protein kinase